jgi:hypothetical protein
MGRSKRVLETRDQSDQSDSQEDTRSLKKQRGEKPVHEGPTLVRE